MKLGIANPGNWDGRKLNGTYNLVDVDDIPVVEESSPKVVAEEKTASMSLFHDPRCLGCAFCHAQHISQTQRKRKRRR